MNAWLGPVALRVAENLPLGWHSQSARGFYKPPPMRLPMKSSPSLGLSNSSRPTRRMGDDSSFMSPTIGTSVLLIAGGAAGLYLSAIVPPPGDSVAKGLGIAAIGWGVYNIFSWFSGGQASVDSKAKSSTSPVKTMSEAALAKVNGAIVSPLSGSKPALTTDGFFGPIGFDIESVWSNGSEEMGNFPYDVLATSVSGPGVTVDGKTRVSKVYTGNIKDLPAGKHASSTLFIDLFQPPEKGTWADFPEQRAAYFNIFLQLRKISPGGPTAVGNPVQFGPFDYK